MSKIKNENTEEDYLALIFKYLNKNPMKIETDGELEEIDFDLSSKNIFQSLYNNFVFFYNNYKEEINSSLDLQKYFRSEIKDILNILYENIPECFHENDFIKSALIFLIYSYKSSIDLNPELILRIFSSFYTLIKSISHISIEKEIQAFEINIVRTIKSLINKYEVDYEKKINIPQENPMYKNLIFSLFKFEKKLPLYLRGFLEYDDQNNAKKFLIIKIYKYFEMSSPFDKEYEEMDYNLYLGYALYGIVSNKEKFDKFEFSFKEFIDKKNNRIKDTNAKNILELSIKLLNEKFNYDFIECLNKEKIDFIAEPPKISNNYDNTKEYYKDLYEQLIYYLNKYKNNNKNNKICQITKKTYTRVFWLNLNRLLLLNLKENDLEKHEIKIIFYFIVNLFNPEADSSKSIEFKEETVPILLFQCPINNLDNIDIFKIIDRNYSQFYPNSKGIDTLIKLSIDKMNQKIQQNANVKDNINNNKIKEKEINKIVKCNKYLPFSLLKQYIKDSDIDANINEIDIMSKIFLFYGLCYYDLESNSQQDYLNKIGQIKILEDNQDDDIKNIVNDNSFLELINKIMTSKVMQDAYVRISNWYLTNGNIVIDGEMKKIDGNENLINKQPLINYYEKFIESAKVDNYSNLFIVMELPEFIKGFTFRFLKVVLNSKGIVFNSDNNENKITLLKAYLVFVIIHEQNHYIKRYLNVDIDTEMCKTPKIGEKDEAEGGKFLIKLLFGDPLIKKTLNIKQAEYILDIKNWQKSSVKEFRDGFLAIKTEDGKENSIIFLSSETDSICDHTKLFA